MAKPRTKAQPVNPFTGLTKDATALIHVGKTGGTYLKSIVKANLKSGPKPVALCRHHHTVQEIQLKMGGKANIAFVFRDPASRFMSGFLSRQRQGRPTYQSAWSPAEAVVFAYFPTPDAMARALGGSDETAKSMAIFGMENINHLQRNYQFYFGGPQRFDKIAGNVTACLDLKDLNSNLDWFLGRIGMAGAKPPAEEKRHESPGEKPVLSDEGLENLRAYWANEFTLYDKMTALSAKLRGV